MIENRKVATSVIILMQELTKELNESVRLAQLECDQDEYKVYRRAVGIVMSDILDILNPLYKIYPEFKPEGFE